MQRPSKLFFFIAFMFHHQKSILFIYYNNNNQNWGYYLVVSQIEIILFLIAKDCTIILRRGIFFTLFTNKYVFL
jgi:hypothetical protein